MVWLLAIVIVVLLGGIAVVASGHGGSLVEVEPDRPDAVVPDDQPIAASHLRALRLSVALRGYRMDEVDDLLDRLASELDERDTRIRQFETATQPASPDQPTSSARSASATPGDQP